MLVLNLFVMLLCFMPCRCSRKGNRALKGFQYKSTLQEFLNNGFVQISVAHLQISVHGCGFDSSWLESVNMSMKLTKQGFHRDLVYELQHGLTSFPVNALLLHKLPCGVYMDQYQLAALKEDTGLEVILDSAVDLESPAHMSSSFSALVFLGSSGPLRAVVPVHGRYHRPSSSSGWEQVTIKPPRLLLRQENCEILVASSTHSVVEAPCTVQNRSLCTWLEIQGLQVPSVILEIPVGDSSLTFQVCVVTTLVTLLCCAFIFRAVWKHGIY